MRVIVEADGGSRGNPGPAGYGAVVFDASTGAVLAERKESIGIATNNVAEYQGLIAGLSAAAELGATEVQVRMDSKLVVEQMSGRWQVRHPAMQPLSRQARELARGFRRIDFGWIPRAQNSHADRLANEAMDAAGKAARPELEQATLEPATLEPAELEQATLEPANNNSAWVLPDTAPTRFILLRHGVTEYSLAKRFAGRSDLPLTELGIEQARQAAGRVAELGPADVLLSSPLLRTRQTAAAVADRLGIPAGIDEGVIESDYGDWDGYTFEEIRQSSPAELARWLADPAVAPPGGESFDQVTRRVRRARDRILAAHREQTIVLVSHVSPIKILVQLALGAPAAAVHRMFLSPASISVIDYFTDGPVSLRSFNDTAHLSAG
ncbi:MAG: bifunctional RNase H/acid phosphatase [Actinomycetota bacterium]|nr:bifunctional RNase H/acid phosphatase [Actinomycetota bacterium]MDQ2956158.1 bifunctional RNase H/acid phosphatase [Actinomycetota bacterium]